MIFKEALGRFHCVSFSQKCERGNSRLEVKKNRIKITKSINDLGLIFGEKLLGSPAIFIKADHVQVFCSLQRLSRGLFAMFR